IRLLTPSLAFLVILTSLPVAAQEAQRPESNTTGAERTINVIWEPGAAPPDISTVLRRLVATEAGEVGQRILNVQPDMARRTVHLAPKVAVADHSCTLIFSVILDTPRTHARPAAK